MDFDGYCQEYLRQWEQRATVRRLPRTRLPADGKIRELFPVRLQPLASHPDVAARGPEVVREVLVRTAYAWQSDIALLETDVVCRLCCELAARGPGCPLPDSARQVALTIATDEAYHAYAAREFIEDVRRHTGIEPEPVGDREPGLAKSLAVALRSAPAGLRREVETLVLCFAEHFVTEALFGLSKDIEPDNPFHMAIREHLLDEGRHQGYFLNLLRHVWGELDEERRRLLGAVLPTFLDDFLHDASVMRQADEAVLIQTGFGPEDARRIVNDKQERFAEYRKGGKDKLPHAQHCVSLARLSGMLDHAPTRAALTASGWVAAA